MNSGSYITAKRQQKRYPDLERQVEMLNIKKEYLYKHWHDVLVLQKVADQACNNLEHAGKRYELQDNVISMVHGKCIDELARIFSEFQLKSPFVIVTGSQEHRTYQECRYGEGSSYRLAIENFIESMEEMKLELRYNEEVKIKESIEDFIFSLQAFFSEVRKTPISIAA